MTTLLQTSINFSTFSTPHDDSGKRKSCFRTNLPQPTNFYSSSSRRDMCSFRQNGLRMVVYRQRLSSPGLNRIKDGIWVWNSNQGANKKKRRMVLVKFNQGLGGGGGGGRDNGNTGRVLGNLALAIGLTYLSMTGQLGWVLDAVVSVWLLAVLLPIVGLGAFIWWAGRDMVQSNCPNCGNEFQVFKSTLNEGIQLCPYCSQPFSVVGNEFVRDPVKFSNQSTTFDQAFSDFSSRSKKGKKSSVAVVDVEAEIKDVD